VFFLINKIKIVFSQKWQPSIGRCRESVEHPFYFWLQNKNEILKYGDFSIFPLALGKVKTYKLLLFRTFKF
jgi:hypothetical protein